MAPITTENIQIAQKLRKFCEIRHLPINCLEITIVDRKHLFQSKTSPVEEINPKVAVDFENIFYTNDTENVEKTKNMLYSIWQNARAPFALKMESLLNPSTLSIKPVLDSEYSVSKPESPYRKMTTFVEEKPETLTEEEVLNTIISGKKYPARNWPKNILKFYGRTASAAIDLPENLNMPRIIVFGYNWNQQSSFGNEDTLSFYVWRKAPEGFVFDLSTVITNNNLAIKMRKKICTGTPAENNIHLVKRDQLQVRIHGNTAFIGWAVPIPLLPSKQILPPASLLIEGYSRLKTSTTCFKTKSGVKITHEGNGYDAFITFFHPQSKYAGPGTDGLVCQDAIMTWVPPPSVDR